MAKRPCQCDKAKEGQPRSEAGCDSCWLFWNHAGYRRLWSEPARTVVCVQLRRRVRDQVGAVVQRWCDTG